MMATDRVVFAQLTNLECLTGGTGAWAVFGRLNMAIPGIPYFSGGI